MPEDPPRFPFAAARGIDLPSEYARLREQEPVIRVRLASGDLAWIVTRYDDVRRVFADARFSRAALNRPGAVRSMPVAGAIPGLIVAADPPDHTRLRKLVAPAFTSRRIEALRPRIEQVSEGLLDTVAAGGPPADLVADYAVPLPLTIICELLGVPYGDRAQFSQWVDATLSSPDRAVDEVRAAAARLMAYLAGLIEAKRRDPADDLLGTLIGARDDEDRLSEDELVGFAVGLLVAGFETTASELAHALLLLLRHPDQLAWLREDLARMPAAVEELLRCIPLSNGLAAIRIATEDVELGGVVVRTGEAVLPLTASANRDAGVFTGPERLDLTRATNPHLAFGHGIHHCLGRQLARIELHVGIAAVLRRFPGLRLAVGYEDLTWKPSMALNALAALPVAW